jgi:hypothetical protein
MRVPRRFLTVLAAVSLIAALGVTSLASAAVNPVTPSTNDINRTLGWAHIDQVSQGTSQTTLSFISTRPFYSCFEYRTDGDTSQVLVENGGDNYNPLVTDGLYPYVCENNSSSQLTIPANGYVEVRMVFGAEADERFDWTTFEVLPKCTAAGLTGLTAAFVNPSTDVTGSVDATGCDIGVYYNTASSNVADATIFGATYAGVYVDGAAVDVTDSTIYNIGDGGDVDSFTGAQHGWGIYFTGAGASGTISGNDISAYQKNGIVVGFSAKATVTGNTTTGNGPVSYIAQNGIVIRDGASASVTLNTMTDVFYLPKDTIACGLILYHAAGVSTKSNVYRNDERNQCNVGKGGGQFTP